MPLPAPVMMTDLPSRRPMRFSLPSAGACRRAEFQTNFQTPMSLEAMLALTYSHSKE
jgi:hypothetical protein